MSTFPLFNIVLGVDLGNFGEDFAAEFDFGADFGAAFYYGEEVGPLFLFLFQFHSCTIISHITIHIFFFYHQPMTDYDDDNDDSLRRNDSLRHDWHWEGVASLWGGGRSSIFISF